MRCKYQGDMVLHNNALWIYVGTERVKEKIGGAVDPADFVQKSRYTHCVIQGRRFLVLHQA